MKSVRQKLPSGVWAVGMVSLFMDMSSEMVHGLLPVFMAATLGASPTLLGLIEGGAEATAAITKLFSGVISDRIRKRKALILLGYGVAALTKPLFPLATTVGTVVAARGIDRVGKGIRGAPRDALVADITPPEQRGASFGLRQSLDNVGAILGPLIAIGLMIILANDIRAVLWFAVIPAILALLTIIFFVKEPDSPPGHSKKAPPRLRDGLKLGPAFNQVLVIGSFLTLARFSEAFLVLRATGTGLAPQFAPLVLVVLSLTYAATAFPVGILSDKMSRRMLLAMGLVLLIVADIALMSAKSAILTLVGIGIWGLHMGFSQGILSTMVADSAESDQRATAFGFYSLVTGVLLLIASGLAGLLWEHHGPAITFAAGGIFSFLALIMLFAYKSPSASTT